MHTGKTLVYPWKQSERDSLQVADYYTKRCYQGVWDCGFDNEMNENIKTIVTQPRGDTCFFWPYQEGMLFSAAVALQKRDAESKQQEKSYRVTKIQLIISIISLLGIGGLAGKYGGWLFSVIKDFFLGA